MTTKEQKAQAIAIRKELAKRGQLADAKATREDDMRIAEMFGVAYRSVTANKAHVTMGTDTDNPQPRKKSSKGKKKGYNPNGVKKIDGRLEKVKAIINSKKLDGRVLTLCGESVLIEGMLYSKGAKNLSYDLVENDQKKFNKILQKVSEMKIDVASINKCDMFEMIGKAYPNQYAHAILDYCDSLNSNIAEVETAFRKNIVGVGGTICMTFATRGVQPVMKVDVEGEEAKNVRGAKKFFEQFKNYELVESFTYRDGTPMMVFVYKRIS